MATQAVDKNFALVPGRGGLMSLPGITAESSRTVSELLQRNEQENHGYSHSLDLLTCYDFGASPTDLRNIYTRTKEAQRPCTEVDPQILQDLADKSKWEKYIEKNEYYPEFLAFFQKEMAEMGWKKMLQKWLFAGTESADDLLVRCISGLYHGMIRISHGVEFELPGLIAEGLAQAVGWRYCWGKDIMFKIEKEAAATKDVGDKSLRELLEEMRNDPKIKKLAQKDILKSLGALITEGQDVVASYAKQYRVPIDKLDEKVAESINISAYMFGGAMRKDKVVRVDFYLLHCLTASICLTVFNSQDWITPENKARLVEWKARFDMLIYAAIATPELHLDEIVNYVPKVSHANISNPWLGLVERAIHIEDDGHTIKTTRALMNGERLAARYSGAGVDLPVVGDMWKNVAAMGIDSGEGLADCHGGPKAWVRGAGFDEAWEVFGPREPVKSNL